MNAADLAKQLDGFEPWSVTCEDNHIVFGPFMEERSAVVYAANMTLSDGGKCLYRAVPFALVIDEERLSELAAILGKHEEQKHHGYL